jgi:DNA-binding Xre family transcriptional regulator|tara:strand:- start:344 stop:601 length:258 start_codon:yes stop_codon:yes gene_type:complete
MAKTKIKEILIKKRISQTELYNLIREKCNSHLGQDVISRIVNGKKKNYELFTLLKLCVALNVSPNQIVERDYFVDTQLKKSVKRT